MSTYGCPQVSTSSEAIMKNRPNASIVLTVAVVENWETAGAIDEE
ncbi:hypothetical protein [Umezakia ovalisporum]|nr:hypothetical protein [Umezakia ovalisporum]MDH6086625.1 hypothetical protein [Umezakia ovalisporum TAC611]MDH6089992.1 hypothetical protein [Umezakia ovalisporum Ak1311]